MGYRRALFWDTRSAPGGAWEYTARPELQGYPIDASRTYWREFWRRRPLVDATFADFEWWAGSPNEFGPGVTRGYFFAGELPTEPRMVCGIHADNMSGSYRPDVMSKPEWRRAPEYDAYCAAVLGGTNQLCASARNATL